MKINLFSKALLMSGMLAMVACSNDEPVIDNGNNNTPLDGDVAYLNINITDVNALSRAAGTTSPGYEDGSINESLDKGESAVSSAKFMFFDGDGVYKNLEVNIWKDGGMKDPENDNIEHVGQNTLVLRGIKGDNFPEYMLVVLNDPDFKPETSLEATSRKISDIRKKGDGNFIMSTTSFLGENSNKDDKFYYATKLNSTDFLKEPSEGPNYIEVYVERLAAKVKLAVNSEIKSEILEDGKIGYPLKITIGGTGNNDNTDPEEGAIVEGDNTVYVKILGWGLNATTRECTISKQLDTAWSEDNLWENWQKTDDHRSFWGKSAVYNTEVGVDNLDYITYDDLKYEIDGIGYTREHTNKTDFIGKSKLDKSKVTSVLVKAQACNKKGEGLDLVNFGGLYYTFDGYKRMVLNVLDANDKLNFYYVSGTKTVTVKNPILDENGKPTGEFEEEQKEVNVYSQVDVDEFKLQLNDNGTGRVSVVMNDEGGKINKDTELFADAEGKTPANYSDLVSNLAEAQKNWTSPVASRKGAMYYNVPVEHLNTAEFAEGSYGVVRNHYYKLTINKLANMGHGVFVPDGGTPGVDPEPIIPDPNEEDKYWLGATINIVSWKVVEQGVEL